MTISLQLISLLLSMCIGPIDQPVKDNVIAEITYEKDSIQILYEDCKLEGLVEFEPFKEAIKGFDKYQPLKSILTIVDFALPSNRERFFVIDLEKKNSCFPHLWPLARSVKYCIPFKQLESIQAVWILYRRQQDPHPKHGMALLLNGLQKGIMTMLTP